MGVPAWALALTLPLAATSCTESRDSGGGAAVSSSAPSAAPSASARPSGSTAPLAAPSVASATSSAPAAPAGHCPPEMVKVGGAYCVDRWEMALVDEQGRQLSPYYPVLRGSYDGWIENRRKEAEALEAEAPEGHVEVPFPPLPAWQRAGVGTPKAVSRPSTTPNGYLTRHVVRDACAKAGKRICKHDEWKRACRGERDTQQPYGPKYEGGSCNIFRDNHPGNLLFGKFTVGHLDPRMNTLSHGGRPLLKSTGATLTCKSQWGSDAIYDMVGNIDEWVEAPKGGFAGGFYARSRKGGCDELISAHPPDYQDYSTGGRCCADLIPD